MKSHSKVEGAQTDWWYVENGKPYYYGDEACSGEHPATPASLGTPQFVPEMMFPLCEDSMGRGYQLAEMSYHPRGKKATLKIENCARHEPRLCRSAWVRNDQFELSNAPAEITFTSAHSGVYHGTIKGVFAEAAMCSPDYIDYVQRLDSITIYTE